ncbi:MAG: putative toxin-antitoxin system toxin component, PIN family [Planctomycetes bacterium]|nr:putative toxin-antitoxin system toxin component, PIN family [Planctomycetota bacterium]
MRLLLDNNILVSSLLSPAGPPARLADAWHDELFDLVTSIDQIQRLANVLSRPKIRDLIGDVLAQTLLADIEAASILVEPRRDVQASTDPEDNLILGTAVAGAVELLVTGDKRHLLPLQQFEGIHIVTAVEALQRLGISAAD